MDKNLTIIQKCFKFFQIICKIGFAFCVLGVVSGLISYFGISSLSSTDLDEFMTLLSSYGSFESFSIDQYQIIMLITVIETITGAILFFYGNKYFKAELIEGTPFTATGASNIRIVGILTILLPLASDTICSVILSNAEITGLSSSSDTSALSIGLFLVILSFIFQYGTDLTEKVKELSEENNKTEND